MHGPMMGGPHHVHHAPPPRSYYPYYGGFGRSLLSTGLTAFVAGAIGGKVGSSIGKNASNNAQYYEVCNFCPSCGTKRSNGANTCSNCGASLIK